MNELKITAKDWLIVAASGALLASSLSFFCFFTIGMDSLYGALCGGVFGIFVSMFSAVLIPFMNSYILPKTPKLLWNPIAAIFSFLSGFFGSLASFEFLKAVGGNLPPVISQNHLITSILVGINGYLIGALIYRFVKARNKNEELERLLAKSRLDSLETQLNSHFLFNALNSITELIHVDADKAEEMTLKLSAFLRAVMAEKAVVELGEEIENAKRYIELENIRFNGAIKLDIDIQQEAVKAPVPKFSIQLLCENGVKHGFSDRQEGLCIKIEAKKVGQNLRITVSNNGAEVQNAGFGVGLNNLKERLERLQNGSLQLKDKKNVSYEITVEGVKS